MSRAGYKLDAAIQHFGIHVKDKYCLDAGIGTGGFTDCLLQYGAIKVERVHVQGTNHERSLWSRCMAWMWAMVMLTTAFGPIHVLNCSKGRICDIWTRP